jgi:cytochrome P450
LPRCLRRFCVDRNKQFAHIRQMATHVRLNAEKTERRLAEIDGGDSASDYGSRGATVLDSMIEASRNGRARDRTCAAGLTPAHLTGLPIEFLSAGTETSSATLLWLLLLMAAHPHVQDRVHAEIDRQLVTGHQLTHDDRHRLPFTEAVILETMRLFPAVPLALPHYTRTGITITGSDPAVTGSWSVPADTIIISNLWSTGRDAAVWSSPEQFRPERFLTVKFSRKIDGSDSNGAGDCCRGGSDINLQSWYSADDLESSSETGDCGVQSGYQTTSGTGMQSGNRWNGMVGVEDCAADLAVDRKVADACLPFGVGRRRCVGELLGRLQVFMFFVTIMRSCRVAPPSDASETSLEESFGDVIKPQPYKLRIVERSS